MVTEAVLQYGAERVARYLRVEVAAEEEVTADSILRATWKARPPQGDTSAAAVVFSQFLRHLAYLELAPTTTAVPEMQWFPPTRVVA
ncbi:hypothetical protein [Kibdelosporangium phytohabitans]|uniref:hypothetical protein n=1 Tax=Kibdelosporangium phytohabitans TaxID=860235 RepID=UPI001A0CD0B7|nr:hypothetical protein [Kibdelosporangium phytohabitans]MBE1463642.1 hypothetical protein [Kibdelosporangium phytohabitans]